MTMIQFHEAETHRDSRGVVKTYHSSNAEHGHYDVFEYEDGTHYLKWWPAGRGAVRVAEKIPTMKLVSEIATMHQMCVGEIQETIQREQQQWSDFMASLGVKGLGGLSHL